MDDKQAKYRTEYLYIETPSIDLFIELNKVIY